MGRLVYIREVRFFLCRLLTFIKDREQNARFGSSSVSPSASSNGKDSEPDRQLFVGNVSSISNPLYSFPRTLVF